MAGKKRNYSSAFLEYGFVNLPHKCEDRPQCVICNKVLINESLKPSKLKDHLLKCHPELRNQDLSYFERKAKQLQDIRFGKSGTAAKTVLAAVEASYEVAYKVAQQQKAHTIAESLIMPCARMMVAKVCGEEQAKKLSVISVSNNTIRRRIDEMASDILAQVVQEVKNSPYNKFSLQFDESTDVSSCAILLGFIRYVHLSDVKEEFLLCENLTTTAKGEDVFRLVSRFLEKNGLHWNNVQQVSVDGAPAMMGGNRGFRGFVQRENVEIMVDHCSIHRYSLVSKTLPDALKAVFIQVVKVVNFIKARDVNSRVFRELCKEMGEKYELLLYHTEVRWLSRGKVINRVIELREAVQLFLQQEESDLAHYFSSSEWLFRLCYLGDIFNELNKGNLELQGRNVTIFDAKHAISVLIGKLKLWNKRVAKGVVAQFPTLDKFVDGHENGEQILEMLKAEIQDHLHELNKKMEEYFPDLDTSHLQWCTYPFTTNDDQIDDCDFPAKEEWITLRLNETWKLDFSSMNLQAFWVARINDTPTLARRALRILTSFSTTYRCEQGFSVLMGMKTKKRNRLDVSNDARIALSSTKPLIKRLASQMQAQSSH